MPPGVKHWPVAATGEGATEVWALSYSEGWPIRPACISWATIRPPSACTASVTARQDATCSGWCRPGVFRKPWPTWEGCTPSVMISPAEARWA